MDMSNCCECSKCKTRYHEVQEHHIVKRGQAKYLLNCDENKIYLCWEHHHGTNGVHGSKGSKLDHALKKEFQDKLALIFGSNIYYTVEEITEKLNISIKATESLVKLILPKEGKYIGESIIRECMGGKLVI